MALNRILSYLGLISLSVAGCGDYISGPKVEADPNRATDVTSDHLFNLVQVAGFYAQEGHVARAISMWMEQMAGTQRQMLGIGQYSFTEADFKDEMNDLFLGGGLIDIRRIVDENETRGNRIFAGIGKVWEAVTMGTAASIWGDLPYSQAAGETATPSVDEQEEIYEALQSLLDEAIEDLESGEGSAPINDFVYERDERRWIEAAHSLKARFFMHWAEVDPANYDRALDQALMGISSHEGDFESHHSSAEGETNSWHQFYRSERGTDLRAGQFMVELLQAREDPRLAIYYGSDSDGEISGAAPGEARAGASPPGDVFLRSVSSRMRHLA